MCGRSKIMVLFRYLGPIDSTLNPHGPLSKAFLRCVIEEVNKELEKSGDPTKKARPVPLVYHGEEGKGCQVRPPICPCTHGSFSHTTRQ